MDFNGIYDHLRAIGTAGIVGCDLPREPDPEDKKDKGRGGDAYVIVDPDHWVDFLTVCRDDEALGFELLIDLSATDPGTKDEDFWVNVQLLSIKNKHRLAIKLMLPKEKASIATATTIYRAAQWHERECAEMFGIRFEGHPDPRNILLPNDWEGYPLRKDYVFPTEYHGISCE